MIVGLWIFELGVFGFSVDCWVFKSVCVSWSFCRSLAVNGMEGGIVFGVQNFGYVKLSGTVNLSTSCSRYRQEDQNSNCLCIALLIH